MLRARVEPGLERIIEVQTSFCNRSHRNGANACQNCATSSNTDRS